MENLIKQFRDINGLSQDELAELINDTAKYELKIHQPIKVTKKHISNWENNLVESIKLSGVVSALAHLMQCSPSAINKNMAEIYHLNKKELIKVG